MSIETIQAAIERAGANRAPRVTPDDIEAAIASEFYFRASEGAKHPNHVELHNGPVGGKLGTARPLELLTIAVLVLRNGFTVVGTSACASPENFDAEIGRKVARADAVRQVWPLLGYALRDALHNRTEGNRIAETLTGAKADSAA